jgi:hypothetical protein
VQHLRIVQKRAFPLSWTVEHLNLAQAAIRQASLAAALLGEYDRAVEIDVAQSPTER